MPLSTTTTLFPVNTMIRGMKSGKRETKELHNWFRMTHEVVPSGLINLGMSVHKLCGVPARPKCRKAEKLRSGSSGIAVYYDLEISL
jgi:hypothetical protein